MNRAADILLSIAARIMPREHAEWVAAMRAESAGLPGHRALVWAIGCVFATGLQRLRHAPSLYLLLFPTLMVAFLYIDWNTIETSLSLTTLMLSAALPAYVCPDRIVVTGIVAGVVPIIAHALADFTWILVPYYQYKPLEGWEWLIVCSLLAPSLAGAYIGSGLRRVMAAHA